MVTTEIVPTNVREEVLCLSRLPSSKIPEIRISFLEIGPILEPMDEAKSRPGVVHGADFIVDQADFQAYFPNAIFGQVRRHSGSLLGPCDPQSSGRGEAFGEAPELFDQLGAAVGKENHHVEQIDVLRSLTLSARG